MQKIFSKDVDGDVVLPVPPMLEYTESWSGYQHLDYLQNCLWELCALTGQEINNMENPRLELAFDDLLSSCTLSKDAAYPCLLVTVSGLHAGQFDVKNVRLTCALPGSAEVIKHADQAGHVFVRSIPAADLGNDIDILDAVMDTIDLLRADY